MSITKPAAGLAAILCSIGLMTAGANGAQAAEPLAADLPDHIVNGDFEYPAWESIPLGDNRWWTSVADGASYVVHGSGNASWEKIDGFDRSRFGWTSTQTDCVASNEAWLPGQCRAGAVELQHSHEGDNAYAEITAAQEGTAIYQDIATIPGAVYTWSLKHASLNASHVDAMSVMIGEPGHETAQEAERVSANGHGDTLGPVGTIIRTKVTNQIDNQVTDQWETYEGTYTATSTITRFTFAAVEGVDDTTGNKIDDISFEISYPLTYELNGGSGVNPNKEQ